MKTTRREWLALAALSACARKKATGYPGYALIATSGENSISAVDLTSFRLVKQIDVGAPPDAVIAAQNRSLVLTPSTGSVHVVDAALRHLSVHKLADQLSAIRLTADQKLLIGTAVKSRELVLAEAASLRILRRHKLEAEAVALDVATTPYAAVSMGDYRAVELFHLETGQRWRAQLPGAIGGLRFRADGQMLLVAGLYDRSLTAFEVPGLQTIAELPLGMAPENLCFNADAGQLFISGAGMDAVAIVFPYDTLEVEQTVLTGRDPGVMACSVNPEYLFVASHSGSDVCVMDVTSRKVIGIVGVGQKPDYIAVTPDSQYALVLDEASGDMAVIRVTGIRVTAEASRLKSGAGLFTVVPVGAKPVQAAIVPKQLG
jgi:YVTN family beta-propeller protein